MKNGIRRLGSNGNRQPPHSGTRPRTLRLVSAALILREHGGRREVLICQRKADQPMALKWEFPGGKIEPGESAEEALRRELNEELGITAEIAEPVTQVRHNYRNGGAVDLQFFAVRSFQGEIDNRIFQEVRWSDFPALPGFDFLAADIGLVRDLAEGRIALGDGHRDSTQHAA
ncbi:(deoxy)nucleoside triphosphate pyrophosphohydrolase [Terriglobus sp.]|uniref:(deoxy)nucleoside triphosphate pyrophosphohydrolase n=1 Tax=Terriglobus sp. TaxID=1889013 RepID=UPI003AFF7D0C